MCLTFSTVPCHYYISFIVTTHFSIIIAKAGVWMSACGNRGTAVLWDCASASPVGTSLNGKQARVDLLVLPHASAKGTAGNKCLLLDHSYIVVATGCFIRPWEQSVGWLNYSHVLVQAWRPAKCWAHLCPYTPRLCQIIQSFNDFISIMLDGQGCKGRITGEL